MFELQQEGEEPVVLIHTAVRYYDIQRPVHLGERESVTIRTLGLDKLVAQAPWTITIRISPGDESFQPPEKPPAALHSLAEE